MNWLKLFAPLILKVVKKLLEEEFFAPDGKPLVGASADSITEEKVAKALEDCFK